MTIVNKYKDTFDDFIDNSDTESSDWLKCLGKDHLNENISVTLLELAPKIHILQVYQHHKIALFDPKSGRVQYRNSHRYVKDEKNKRGGVNKKDKRDGEDYWGIMVDLVI